MADHEKGGPLADGQEHWKEQSNGHAPEKPTEQNGTSAKYIDPEKSFPAKNDYEEVDTDFKNPRKVKCAFLVLAAIFGLGVLFAVIYIPVTLLIDEDLAQKVKQVPVQINMTTAAPSADNFQGGKEGSTEQTTTGKPEGHRGLKPGGENKEDSTKSSYPRTSSTQAGGNLNHVLRGGGGTVTEAKKDNSSESNVTTAGLQPGDENKEDLAKSTYPPSSSTEVTEGKKDNSSESNVNTAANATEVVSPQSSGGDPPAGFAKTRLRMLPRGRQPAPTTTTTSQPKAALIPRKFSRRMSRSRIVPPVAVPATEGPESTDDPDTAP